MTAPFRIAMLIGISLSAMAETSHSQVYKWVDENGVTHYTERPPAAAKGQTAKKLDIELRGNDRPPYTQECNTIRCQYERLRADRLLREAEQREEDESRARVLAATKPSPFSTAPTDMGTGWIDLGVPIYHRPIIGRPLPAPPPSHAPAPPEPSGGSRTPAGTGVP
jgi:Domain of unknown function (DUF4124)